MIKLRPSVHFAPIEVNEGRFATGGLRNHLVMITFLPAVTGMPW